MNASRVYIRINYHLYDWANLLVHGGMKMWNWIKHFIKDLIKFTVTIPMAWYAFRKTSKRVRSARVYILENGKVDYFLREYEKIDEGTPKWAKIGILDEFIIHADEDMKKESSWDSVLSYRKQLEKD